MKKPTPEQPGKFNLECLLKGHDWDIWWQRSKSFCTITKRSCFRCGKIEKYYDVFGA